MPSHGSPQQAVKVRPGRGEGEEEKNFVGSFLMQVEKCFAPALRGRNRYFLSLSFTHSLPTEQNALVCQNKSPWSVKFWQMFPLAYILVRVEASGESEHSVAVFPGRADFIRMPTPKGNIRSLHRTFTRRSAPQPPSPLPLAQNIPSKCDAICQSQSPARTVRSYTGEAMSCLCLAEQMQITSNLSLM